MRAAHASYIGRRLVDRAASARRHRTHAGTRTVHSAGPLHVRARDVISVIGQHTSERQPDALGAAESVRVVRCARLAACATCAGGGGSAGQNKGLLGRKGKGVYSDQRLSALEWQEPKHHQAEEAKYEQGVYGADRRC
jgi:hypothetical protein